MHRNDQFSKKYFYQICHVLPDFIENLNHNQARAIDHLVGPVMVVAGPGTGKTQMLSARISKLILQGVASPTEILCLTFTDAACFAIRERLRSFIGAQAYNVQIHTYHSYANWIIQENRELLGVVDYEPISDLERIELLRSIIDGLSKDSPLYRFKGQVYYEVGRLAALFAHMKKEDLKPEELIEQIQAYLEDAKSYDKFRYQRKTSTASKGDLKPSYKDEERRMATLMEAVRLYPQYIQAMHLAKRYDYDDMIQWAIDLMLKDEILLQNLRAKAEHILVDEYQDTNGIQNHFLQLLLGDQEAPNLFVVGDDDQSIYKFQGANVTNILGMYDRYRTTIELVVLDQNYRSVNQILDVSSALIQRNHERLVHKVEGLVKDLNSALYTDSGRDHIQFRSYENPQQEIIEVSKQVQELIDGGVCAEEIAIIYRNHRQIDDFIGHFDKIGLAYQVVRTANALDQKIVDSLVQLLRMIHEESKRLGSGEAMLFEALHYRSMSSLTSLDISLMSLEFSTKKMAWREAMAKAESLNLSSLSTQAISELGRLSQLTEAWIGSAHNYGLVKLVSSVITGARLVERAMQSDHPVFELQAINSFLSYCNELCVKNPQLKLAGLLEHITTLQQHDIVIPLNKLSRSANGIQLMTAHGAKGLEYEHVFIIGAQSSVWERKRRGMAYSLDHIYPGGESDEFDPEEARRLFYVALTRAKLGLHISYHLESHSGRGEEPSLFVTEIQQDSGLQIQKVKSSDADIVSFLQEQVQAIEFPPQDLVQDQIVQKRITAYVLNPSGLNSYLKCPRAFFFQNIIRAPQQSSENLVIGSAVHKALETHISAHTPGDKSSSALAIKVYTTFLEQQSHHFSEAGMERAKAYGEQRLKPYIDYWQPTWNRYDEVQTEILVDNTHIDGIPIRGQIDKIVKVGNMAIVVDYKTGKYAYARKHLHAGESLEISPGASDHEKVHGGDYWRQLVFYKILVENSLALNFDVGQGIIDFIEPEKDNYISKEISLGPKDLEIVKQQIAFSHKQIKAGVFDKGCEQEDCTWCQLLRLTQ